MNLIHRLLRKNDTEMEYDDTMGLLTKEDMQKLRDATKRPESPHRKRNYSIWACTACTSEYYYRILRCPACDSSKIEEQSHPTKYELNSMLEV